MVRRRRPLWLIILAGWLIVPAVCVPIAVFALLLLLDGPYWVLEAAVLTGWFIALGLGLRGCLLAGKDCALCRWAMTAGDIAMLLYVAVRGLLS